MDESVIGAEEWHLWVERGATLLTVNQRLARYLNLQYEQYQIAQGRKVWPSANIFPYSTWLTSQWQMHSAHDDAGAMEVLLTPFQTSWLWKEVVSAQRSAYRSKCDEELSQLAEQAWALLCEWQISPRDLHSAQDRNVAMFKLWLDAYRQTCAKRHWIDAAILPSRVLELLSKKAAHYAKQTILFAGFDDFSPRQLAIIEALKSARAEVHLLDFPKRESEIDQKIYHDAASELTAAALWATRISKHNPDASIGIVIPDLAAQRDRVLRQFTSLMHPTLQLQYGENRSAFNISLGVALSDYPIIRAIYSALAMIKPMVTTVQVTTFLLCRYFMLDERCWARRSAVDVALRDREEVWVNTQVIADVVSRSQADSASEHLSQQLRVLNEFRKSARKKRYPSQWCDSIVGLLKQLGWASGMRLTSAEYQQTVAWQHVLDQFSQLDSVSGELTWSAAVGALGKLTAQTLFQPEAQAVSIHIMGVFETAGLAFDYLWVMGLQDSVLPTFPKPNPFIPISLQKQFSMPHSSSERELHYAQTLLTRLKMSANQLVLSCALHEADLELRPTPLIEWGESDVVKTDALSVEDKLAERILSSAELEFWNDISTPLSEAQRKVKGGVSVLKNQALCPFKAYAKVRLQAEGIVEPSIGLSPMDRGNVLHGVLEDFWREIKSQTQLLALSDVQLDEVLTQIVERRVREIAQLKSMTVTPRFFAMECRRLKTHAVTWLDREKVRPLFTVEAVELPQKLNIGGLEFATKIDRIDRLGDGAWLLIDYKTGQPYVKHWFGERPEEPQLPLYAISCDGPVKGVAFAQLKTGMHEFKGLAECEGVPTGVKAFKDSKFAFGDASWDDLMTEWRAKLTTLAQSFADGVAHVDPKQASVCQSCDYALLCRVTELRDTRMQVVEDEFSEVDRAE